MNENVVIFLDLTAEDKGLERYTRMLDNDFW